MMFGTRDEFHYFECGCCGCLQLVDPPADLARYYPAEKYYSFREDVRWPQPRNPLRRWLKRRRDAAVLFGRQGPFGWIAALRPNPGLDDLRQWLAATGVRSFDASILDVGCGRGRLLHRLASLGFRSLRGVDPFLPADQVQGSVRITAGPLDALRDETFDLIMFHHSLEHMADPVQPLRQAASLLNDAGTCLVRLPLASQGPWRRYGTCWCDLDAPRHFFLHTETSLELAARAAGLHLRHVQYESDPFSYGVSEMYRRGIPLYDEARSCSRDWRELFGPAETRQFEELAAADNVPGAAGRAAFFFSTTARHERPAVWNSRTADAALTAAS
jgi:SAM-dependent methyltransferase